MVDERHCMQLQNAGKHLCDYRISKFSGGACPQIPPARRALPILFPGIKVSCPPVQNLKETPVAVSYPGRGEGTPLYLRYTVSVHRYR